MQDRVRCVEIEAKLKNRKCVAFKVKCRLRRTESDCEFQPAHDRRSCSKFYRGQMPIPFALSVSASSINIKSNIIKRSHNLILRNKDYRIKSKLQKSLSSTLKSNTKRKCEPEKKKTVDDHLCAHTHTHVLRFSIECKLNQTKEKKYQTKRKTMQTRIRRGSFIDV